jgi:hypothetical protein
MQTFHMHLCTLAFWMLLADANIVTDKNYKYFIENKFKHWRPLFHFLYTKLDLRNSSGSQFKSESMVVFNTLKVAVSNKAAITYCDGIWPSATQRLGKHCLKAGIIAEEELILLAGTCTRRNEYACRNQTVAMRFDMRFVATEKKSNMNGWKLWVVKKVKLSLCLTN